MHNSTTAFAAALKELELDSLLPKMSEFGWDTFNDFAFSTSDPSGKDADAFQTQVVDKLLATDGSQKRLVPRLRRLYAQSYVVASEAMTAFANPQGVDEKVSMNPADRASRVDILRSRMTGFALKGQNMPSTALTDRFATMLAKGTVKYVPWDRCTSRERELLEEPDVKGLRITKDGMLLQDVAPDLTTALNGEFMWDYAMRRQACACDIAGLASFEAIDMWHETLKSSFMKSPPAGYRKVSWAQLQAADQALWQWVAAHCERGTKKQPGAQKTDFELNWAKGMFEQEVRQHLLFLPSPSSGPQGATSSGSTSQSDMEKLKNRLSNAEQQLRASKRKHDDMTRTAGNQKGKGKGKGKRKSAGQRSIPVPAAFGSLSANLPNGKRVCFAFNLPQGCPLAKPGEGCFKGEHLCPRCHAPHSLQQCTAPH